MATNSVFPGVVRNWEKGLDKILHGAPHVAVAHAPEDGFNPAEDCSLAAAYLELAAYAHGVGACWAGFLMEVAEGCCAIREILGIPEGHGVYAALMLGYPKYRYKRIPKRRGRGNHLARLAPPGACSLQGGLPAVSFGETRALPWTRQGAKPLAPHRPPVGGCPVDAKAAQRRNLPILHRRRRRQPLSSHLPKNDKRPRNKRCGASALAK